MDNKIKSAIPLKDIRLIAERLQFINCIRQRIFEKTYNGNHTGISPTGVIKLFYAKIHKSID
jgi:hypothetical protein